MEHLNKILFYCCTLLFVLTASSSAIDSIYPNQTVEEGQTIVSAGGNFELGFFSHGNSRFRYAGIWYKKISMGTIVWVANRKFPLVDPIGMLKVTDDGTLQLLSASKNPVWSSQSSKPFTNINPVAQLLDTGNLVIRDEISGNLTWQSFDYPGDTLLPGMKLGVDRAANIKRNLTSWKSIDDPSEGSYTVWMDIDGYPQLYNMKDESNFQQRMALGYDGSLSQYIWVDRSQTWVLHMTGAMDKCDLYGLCGPYASCSINNLAPQCACLEGFEPKLPEEWSVKDWKNGCKRAISTNNENGYNFKKLVNLKLPDTQHSWFNSSMSLQECENLCARNVSCTAYANIDVRSGGRGCLMWSSELIDIRDAPERDNSGQDIYIKMSSNPNLIRVMKKKKSHIKVTLSIVFAVVLVSLTLMLYAWTRKKRSYQKDEVVANKDQQQDFDLPLFSLNKIVEATSNFSINNKLGQGGFGAVYKGLLEEGGEIAVKRLSKTSRQGLVEFQNEVICIAKLQHRNLVKLLGYCLEGEEMMLIYEYMPNKSLDHLLFDENKSLLLDWLQRYHIINGIARGLLYLHQDSRLRIIHRDLKASNILLDSNLNPKISDFGLARMFKEYETEANTNKVVGTLGYISPEYAANGLFSVKSDVFSFGVLVLEIVSGKKNRGFTHQDHHDNLLGHAWRLYKEDNALELVDIALGDSWTVSEVLQSIHVGLSCVQQHAEDRPSMSSVIHMLSGEGALPAPTQPGFFTEVPKPELKSIIPLVPISINEVTITQLDGR